MADDGLSVFKVSGLAVGGAAATRFIDAIRLEVRVPNSEGRGFELLRAHSVSDEDDSRCIWEGLLTIGGVGFIVCNLCRTRAVVLRWFGDVVRTTTSSLAW